MIHFLYEEKKESFVGPFKNLILIVGTPSKYKRNIHLINFKVPFFFFRNKM